MKYRLFLAALFLLVMRFPDKLIAMEATSVEEEERKVVESSSACSDNTQNKGLEAAKKQISRKEGGGNVQVEASMEGDESDKLENAGASPSSLETIVVTSLSSPTSEVSSSPDPKNDVFGSSSKHIRGEAPNFVLVEPVEKTVTTQTKREKSKSERDLDEKIEVANKEFDLWRQQLEALEVEMPFFRFSTDWIQPVKELVKSQIPPEGDSSSIEEKILKKQIYCWEKRQDELAIYLDRLGALKDLSRTETIVSYQDASRLTLSAKKYEQGIILHRLIKRCSDVVEAAKKVQEESTKEAQEQFDEVASSYDPTRALARIRSGNTSMSSLGRGGCCVTKDGAAQPQLEGISLENTHRNAYRKQKLEYSDSIAESVRDDTKRIGEDLELARRDKRALEDAIAWLNGEGQAHLSKYDNQLQWGLNTAKKAEVILEKEHALAVLRRSMCSFDALLIRAGYGEVQFEYYLIDRIHDWAKKWHPELAQKIAIYKEGYTGLESSLHDAITEARASFKKAYNKMRHSRLQKLPAKMRDAYIESIISDTLSKAAAAKKIRDSISVLERENMRSIERIRAEYYLMHPDRWTLSTFSEWQLKRPKTPMAFSPKSDDYEAWRSFIYACANAERAQKDWVQKNEEADKANTEARDEREKKKNCSNIEQLEGLWPMINKSIVADQDAGHAETIFQRAKLKVASTEKKLSAAIENGIQESSDKKKEYITTKLVPKIRELTSRRDLLSKFNKNIAMRQSAQAIRNKRQGRLRANSDSVLELRQPEKLVANHERASSFVNLEPVKYAKNAKSVLEMPIGLVRQFSYPGFIPHIDPQAASYYPMVIH